MIVLKHLANQYNIAPHKLRQMLREQFGIKRSWRWPDEKDPELIKVKKFLEGRKHGKA